MTHHTQADRLAELKELACEALNDAESLGHPLCRGMKIREAADSKAALFAAIAAIAAMANEAARAGGAAHQNVVNALKKERDGWMISYTMEGYERNVVCGHNCMADYQDIDPEARSTELTSLPAATAAIAELRAEFQQLALSHLVSEGEWIEAVSKTEDRADELRAELSQARDVIRGHEEKLSRLQSELLRERREKEVAERYKTDAERLDWLQSVARCNPKMDGLHVWWPLHWNTCQACKGPTIRDGIDAARQIGASAEVSK